VGLQEDVREQSIIMDTCELGRVFFAAAAAAFTHADL
jgi:hypothetical protein